MNRTFIFAVIIGLFGVVGLGRNSFAAGAQVTKVSDSFPFTDSTFTNPCDPSGNSDVTASGIVNESGTLITLTDGSTNGTIRISATGDGTDSQGNTYKVTEMIVEQIVHAQPNEGEVVLLKLISSTGQGFIVMARFADLKNHAIEKERTICLGN